MPKSLENPFRPSPSADPNLSALAEQGFLSESDVTKLKELESQKNRSSEFGIRSSMSNLSFEEGMNATERWESEKEHFENDPKFTRERLINWAKKFNLGDVGWVDKVFQFNDDGSAYCPEHLNLRNLTEPVLPKGLTEIGGHLDLRSLTSAKGLVLPDSIKSLDLTSLTSTEGLDLPDSIQSLSLDSLTSAKGLNLPSSVRELWLRALTSAKGLNLPSSVVRLVFRDLTSAEGLILTGVKGPIHINTISAAEKEKLREKYPNLTIK